MGAETDFLDSIFYSLDFVPKKIQQIRSATEDHMHVTEQLDAVTIERLRKQREFLLRFYRADAAKDPTSRATESSRSNVIALQHTIR
jgi:hypothetical protein